MARGAQRKNVARTRTRRRPRQHDDGGIIHLLAKVVREVESSVQRGLDLPSTRTKFQVVALLMREERARVKAEETKPGARGAEELKRLDGIATILATTAARDPSLLGLLADDAVISDRARSLRRELLQSAGIEVPEDPAEQPGQSGQPEPAEPKADTQRRVVPASVASRQLANPFLEPDYSAVAKRTAAPRRLVGWELIEPLMRSFADGGALSCMDLPEPTASRATQGLELMPHQARLVAAAAAGHRTFLLADEPGLGKTAQALLAAQAADAYPLLVVVPNVVKMNWAREAMLWTPSRPATVVHGDGERIDGFADIIIVNYEVLDRHAGWLRELGLRGMVVDEAHYIKNRKSQRSQNVLQLSERIRTRIADPLLIALTGTPLINDIEDFKAIWQFLGWVDETKPLGELMNALEQIGLTPADRGFSAAARAAVIDRGIVRRRKVDVAADLPARRVADVPVELDDEAGRSIRAAEQSLVRRLLTRYERALAAQAPGDVVEGIDHVLVRQVAARERASKTTNKSNENVFTMTRRIGQAKAGLAADYAAQLARSAGKVVFFAKHIDVMDTAEATFAKQGIRYASIRGDQTASARQKHIDAFTNDPDVAVAVCSLTAAGVGINLQVASNMVLAELSWTHAEQTQAIDRIHRIGQEEPVTAWRIIAAQTLDTKIAELIDSKAGLAARALDGTDQDIPDSADIQLEALVTLLEDALRERDSTQAS
ncbi:DEAD/DEAH box helicase [Nesterenkonia sp. LB17]|uniref:DEAD/DEAH box helicase n=1 Tax=unclassified Nesterenkonia TaxID=2629769 RepID=UPI001F4CF686|nr:DEAD/DEAH box helicase [Nesterenkonia sp. DZ6]MCH8565899.1 DEAD/DEAH box helicase [Nesterenkonia sp. LB17]MCH8570691.1 DEAD/DEAH box helicase [Nesterenkonia sp. AY15]